MLFRAIMMIISTLATWGPSSAAELSIESDYSLLTPTEISGQAVGTHLQIEQSLPSFKQFAFFGRLSLNDVYSQASDRPSILLSGNSQIVGIGAIYYHKAEQWQQTSLFWELGVGGGQSNWEVQEIGDGDYRTEKIPDNPTAYWSTAIGAKYHLRETVFIKSNISWQASRVFLKSSGEPQSSGENFDGTTLNLDAPVTTENYFVGREELNFQQIGIGLSLGIVF